MLFRSVDVHRGKADPSDHLGGVLYVLQWPVIPAGPLLRATDFRHQLWRADLTMAGFSYGVRRVVQGLTKVYLVNQGENLPEEFNDFAWSWDSDVKDGQVLMIGGQIYRCDTTTQTFTRIPNHPLSLQPQAAVRLLALNRQGSLEIDPPLDGPKARERLSSLRFYLTGFDPEDQTPTLPGRARLEMPVHDEDEISIPSSDQTENPKLHFWVRTGQFIETRSWLLKVTRIV